MTIIDKSQKYKAQDMTAIGPARGDAKSIIPSLGDKFLQKYFKQPKEITIRTWIVGKDKEVMVEEKTVKLGSVDVPLGACTYTIVYDAIQNQNGRLIYNTKHRVSNGALRYRMSVDKEVDGRVRKDMCARDNLTAIWSKWQMPLMIALVAIIGCIVAFSILAVVAGQLGQANTCLGNEQCIIGKLAQLKAQAEKEALASGG